MNAKFDCDWSGLAFVIGCSLVVVYSCQASESWFLGHSFAGLSADELSLFQLINTITIILCICSRPL